MSRVGISGYSASTSVLLFGAILLLLLFGKVVLVPLAFAVTLAFSLAPAVVFLERHGIRRKAAVAIISIVTCACAVSGAYILSRQILNIAQTLPGYRANIQRKIDSLRSSSEGSFAGTVGLIEDMSRELAAGPNANANDAVRVRVVGEGSDELQALARIAGSILEPVGQVGIVVVFTIYILVNREDLRHRLLLLAGIGNINVMSQALKDASTRISQYLVMQFQVNACYGTLFGFGLFLLHIPEATLWGVIAGTLRIVPYVGTLMGMALPLTLSIAISSTWWPPVLVLALFLVLETTVANLVEPWLLSTQTGISALALLSSAIFWSMLWGWPGLVLSTPLTVCMVVLGRYVPQLSFLHNLLGKNATLSPSARIYERLLAMDESEVREIAEDYLQGKPLVKLYDAVILPVLSLTEEDKHKGVLEEVRWNFVLLSLGDLVARLSDYEPVGEERSERSRLIAARRAVLQKEFAVICVPAGDKADELATVMLTQLLERGGHPTIILPADAMSEDILRSLAGEKDTVVFLAALQPFAFARTRALCQQVRTYLPDNRIAVAIWNSEEDPEDMLTRFGAARPDTVVCTLAHAEAQVEAWQRMTRKVS